MDIYDYMKCDLCKETYFGHFKSDIFGTISCIDCENKEVLSERLTIDNRQPKDSYEQIMVLDMLERDLGELYPLFSGSTDIPLQQFMDDNGELIPEKLYFKGNDLDFVFSVQQKAYICLKYLDTNEKSNIDMAKSFIKRYLDFRETKLTDEEKDEILAIIASNDFKEMENNI